MRLYVFTQVGALSLHRKSYGMFQILTLLSFPIVCSVCVPPICLKFHCVCYKEIIYERWDSSGGGQADCINTQISTRRTHRYKQVASPSSLWTLHTHTNKWLASFILVVDVMPVEMTGWLCQTWHFFEFLNRIYSGMQRLDVASKWPLCVYFKCLLLSCHWSYRVSSSLEQEFYLCYSIS